MSLRGVVIAVLAFGGLFTIALGVTHQRCGWPVLAIYAALGLAAIIFERGRYQPRLTGAHFEATPERFVDPVSGQPVVVYVDPATGERDYRSA